MSRRGSGRTAAPEPEGPSKAWLDSYADAMTLLLAFFVLLFAMSELDARKYEAFILGLKGEVAPLTEGILEGAEVTVPAPPEMDLSDPILPGPLLPLELEVTSIDRPDPDLSSPQAVEVDQPEVALADQPEVDMERLESLSVEEMIEALDDAEAGLISSSVVSTTTLPVADELLVPPEDEFLVVTQQVAEDLKAALDAALSRVLQPADYSVELEHRGVVVRLSESTMFDSGSATLDAHGLEVVGLVADVLVGFEGRDVLVEGHTDNVPTTGTRWPTNWELSTARSVSVLRGMVEGHGLDPLRVAAVGYADTKPRATNETSIGRASNRRTEVVVLFPVDYRGTS